jgi:hypothetical protein
MTAFNSFVAAVAPFSPLVSFKPFFVAYDSLSPSLPVFLSSPPTKPPSYIVGIGKGRIIVISSSPEPQRLPSDFLEFCENLALGHQSTQDKNVTH